MDIRQSRSRAIGAAIAALARFNQRHPWSHNDHFHGWILRHLPARRDAALDVGCGRGDLVARLGTEFARVDGIDTDPGMRDAARERCRDLAPCQILDDRLEALDGPYDLITMVAVLHHLDVAEAAAQVRRLLRPGGRLLVVGLARVASPVDAVWDIASALANPVVGLLKHPRPARDHDPTPPFPVADPRLSLAELRAQLRVTLPGARVRRRLFFRHTVEWTAPLPGVGAAARPDRAAGLDRGPRFVVREHAAVDPATAWRRLFDLREHSRVVPLTKVTGADLTADQLHVGSRFTGHTRLGPVGLDDVMEIVAWQPPGPGTDSEGRAVIRKVGTVLGGEITAVLSADGEGGTLVRWEQAVRLPIPGLAFLAAPVMRLGYGQVIRRLLRGRPPVG